MNFKFKIYNMWGFLFFAIPSIKPYAIRIGSFDNIYDIWGALSGMLLFLMYIKKTSNRKNNQTVLMMLCFIFIYLIATIFNRYDSVIAALSECLRMMIVPLYLGLSLDKEYQYKILHYLHNIYYLVLLIDCIDIISNFIWKFNINIEYSFLGLDNTAIFAIIPMLTVILYDNLIKYSKIKIHTVIIYLMCVFCKIATNSLTAYIALICFGILEILVYYFRTIRSLLSVRRFFIFSIVMIAGVVVFQVQDYLISILIFFGKNSTLSGRLRIWKLVLEAIVRNPLIGYGKVSADKFISLVGLSIWDSTANHPHNSILAIIFNCGFVGAVFYALLLKNSFSSMKRYYKTKEMATLMVGFISFIIIMFADDYIFQPYFYVLIMFISTFQTLKKCKEV